MTITKDVAGRELGGPQREMKEPQKDLDSLEGTGRNSEAPREVGVLLLLCYSVIKLVVREEDMTDRNRDSTICAVAKQLSSVQRERKEMIFPTQFSYPVHPSAVGVIISLSRSL